MLLYRNISVLIFLILIGCNKNPQPPQKEQPAQSKISEIIIPNFDGEQAFKYLKAQTDFGPRNPGSNGHKQCMEYLYNELKKYANLVQLQRFTHIGYDSKNIPMANIIAVFNPETSPRILLAAHWDTRPRADKEADPKKQLIPILGANDGASGVAILLEIARLLKERPPTIGVDIVLFDGEDYGQEGDLANYLLGSKYFSKNIPFKILPEFGILLDMVGDKNLEIFREKYSVDYAPDIVELVWSVARTLNIHQFKDEIQNAIIDDHLPLNEVGIKTINLIDFKYPDEDHRYWHTHEDTPDKCSPESLEAVGKVLVYIIYKYTLIK